MMRTWELMMGAGLAVWHREKRSQVLPPSMAALSSWLGLALICIGLIAIRPDDAFPGFWALLPVLGSALVIHAGSEAVANRTLLSWRPAVWVGLISYPLYLSHWALWSMTVKVFGDASAWVMRERKCMAIALSFILAWAVYRWLEIPIRHSRKAFVSIMLMTVVAVLGGAGATVFFMDGVPKRPATFVPIKEVQGYLSSIRYSPRMRDCYNVYVQDGWPKKWSCTLGDPTSIRWIGVMGDSHAMALIPAFDQYGKDNGFRVILSSKGACATLLDVHSEYKDPQGCDPIVGRMIETAEKSNPSAIIIVGKWSDRIKTTTFKNDSKVEGISALEYGLSKTIARFAAMQVPVFLLTDVPWQHAGHPKAILHRLPAATLRSPHEIEKILNRNAVTTERNLKDQKAVNAMLHRVVAKYSKNSQLLDISPALCGKSICPVASDGRFLYYDTTHLTESGALYMAPGIEKILSDALAVR